MDSRSRWDDYKQKFWSFINNSNSTIAGTLLLIIGIFVARWGFYFVHQDKTLFELVNDFYANASSELIGIAVTVLIIDKLNQWRLIAQEKKELILQMGSPNNVIAVEAVRKLRLIGWLTDGSVNGSYLMSADLTEADLSESKLKKSKLNGAKLNYVNFRGADLSGSDLTDADITGVIFHNTIIDETTKIPGNGRLIWKIVNQGVAGENLTGIDLRETVLVDANLIGVTIKDSDLRGANLCNSKLTRADLSDSLLDASDLSYAVLRDADLHDSKLQKTNLRNADLSGANLQKTDLLGANLENTKLIGADLRGARMQTDISKAITKGAIYDKETQWLVTPPEDANLFQTQNDFYILTARYGAQDVWVDVKELLVAEILNGKITFFVNNKPLGGDPVKGYPKTLEVFYFYKGGTHTIRVEEDKTLVLPPD